MSKILPFDDPVLLDRIEQIRQDGPAALNPDSNSRKPDWSPLHWFAVSSNPDFAHAQALIAEGLCVDYQNDAGDTALHMAAWNRREDRVRWLLAMGANPNLSNKKGNLPLHQAFRKRAWDEVRELIQVDPDWSAKDRLGKSTLSYAVEALRLDTLPPPPQSNEGVVWEIIERLPKGPWLNPVSNSDSTPLLESLPPAWRSVFRSRWLDEALPQVAPSSLRSPRSGRL